MLLCPLDVVFSVFIFFDVVPFNREYEAKTEIIFLKKALRNGEVASFLFFVSRFCNLLLLLHLTNPLGNLLKKNLSVGENKKVKTLIRFSEILLRLPHSFSTVY